MSEPEKPDATQWRALNLNDRVRVTLTTLGMRLLIEHDERLQIPPGKGIAAMVLAAGGVWETQLWDLMSVIGVALHIGMHEGPIVNNRIEIRPS